MKDIVVADYLIDEDNPIKINFLKDYSEFLLTSKLYDEKIINWQIENKDSLITLGLDMNTLKKSDDSSDESNEITLIKGNYSEEEIIRNLSKSKINTYKTQNILKNIEDRILKEKQNKQNSIEDKLIKIEEKDNQMIIDDRENEMQKINSTIFDINSISADQTDKNNIDPIKIENKDFKIESIEDNFQNESAKEKKKIILGQKRTFKQFSEKSNWQNSMANKTNNMVNILDLSKSKFNKLYNISGNEGKEISFNKNIMGFSVDENPFVPKKQSILSDFSDIKKHQVYQSNSLFTEVPYQSDNLNNNLNKNVSQNKKTIPFKNNFNTSFPSNNIQTLQTNNYSDNPPNFVEIDKNNQSNLNLYLQNQGGLNYSCNNSFLTPQNLTSNMILPSFGTYGNNFLGIKPNFNNENDVFSKAVINNKIYTEDNNDFIRVGQQQSKKVNYREGLFDKAENSSSSILNNNFGKPPSQQNRTIAGTNSKEADSEGDENKENTDDDQEEIKIVEETLQPYLDDNKIINDKKLKISVIRKIAPYYKVLTQQNNEQHLADTVEKIKIIINEDKNDIILLLHYEYLKNLREKVFQKFCKMINKFFYKLNENKVKEFGGDNYNMEIPETLKERLKNIYTKINDYFDKNKELETFAFSNQQVMKLVENFNLNTINPYNNPELRFTKKFADCCEKSNIAYTDIKIKSFIASRIKYQLRADYPEESKESEGNNLLSNHKQIVELLPNNSNNNVISKEINQISNKNLISNSSNQNKSINFDSNNFDNVKIFTELAANVFNTGKTDNIDILSEITDKQIESSKSKKAMEIDADLSAKKPKTKKKSINNKNQIIVGKEDDVNSEIKPDKKAKQFNFVNPFVHENIANNFNNISNSEKMIIKNPNNNIMLDSFNDSNKVASNPQNKEKKTRKDSNQIEKDAENVIDLNSSDELDKIKGKEENTNININNINQPPRNSKFFVKEFDEDDFNKEVDEENEEEN